MRRSATKPWPVCRPPHRSFAPSWVNACSFAGFRSCGSSRTVHCSTRRASSSCFKRYAGARLLRQRTPKRMTVEPRDYLLRVDKPIGPTSHDIVAIARRMLSTRRVGHTGTLDPFASGLMLLCVNRATRIAEFLTGMDKVYRGSARLDAFTDTDDHTGQRGANNDQWRSLDRDRIEAAMRTLTGQIQQVPP